MNTGAGEVLRLLLVEDSDLDAQLLVYELRQAGFQVQMRRVETEEEMRQALTGQEWDVVISDFRLPSFSAPDALAVLHESGQDLPFIIVSGTIGEATAVEIMRAGAHDYLMKDNLNRLAEALRREIREARVRAERRQAEAALRESESRFRMLFERSNDAIFVVERKTGRYLDANRAAERLTGRRIEEIKRLTIFDITPKGAQERLERLAETDETIEFAEVEYVRPDGSVRIARVTAVPINSHIVFGIAHDITESRQAQATLERRARELEGLYATSLKINAQMALMPLLQTIVEQAALLLNAPMGGLYLMHEDGQTLELVVAYHIPERFLGTRLRLGEGLSGRVAQSGKPLMVFDYSQWEGRAPVYEQMQFRRVLGVPLIVKERVIGVIDVTDDRRTDPYSPEELRLLQLIADQAAIAVENAHLLEAAQRELAERRQAEAALRESEQRYRTVVTGADVVSFMLDKNGVFTLSEGKGLAQLGLTPGEVVGVSALELYRDYPSIIQSIQRALTGQTARSEDHIGKIVFDSTYAPFFDEDGQVQGVIGVAVDITERKRAEQALRRQVQELTLLHSIAGMAIRARSLDELLTFVTQEAVKSFYPDNFGFGFLDESGQFLQAHPSYYGLNVDIGERFPVNGCVSGSVVLTGKPRRVPDVRQTPDYLMTNPAIRSELCVPITLDERVIGIINAESTQLDFFTEEDERLMMTIAGQLANAIERFRLFESESRRRREAETLIEAVSALSTSLELERVLEIILDSLEKVVPFDSASIFLLEGDHLRIMLTRGLPDAEQVMNQTFPANDPLFADTLRNGHLLILDDASQDPRFNRWGETSYVRGWMGVPLIARGEVFGYITLDSRTPAAYSKEQAKLARAFVNQAAIAIQNARLFEGIQKSLRELNLAYETTIEGWSRALDLRDRETEGHTLRVTELTLKVAEAMGFSEEERVHIRRGALLHDMGKLAVPDRILLKPDKLTDEEWEIMRMHPLYAFQMLSPIEYLRPALEIPLSHHERWDGSGYPRGLKGQEIPLIARIFAVIDVWDALTSNRPYRPAWSQQATLEYIKKNAGTLFDPNVVETFLKLWEEGKLA
ncbi:MAG: GAF domain-containing protein [Anaerolineales bacterium]|nr:GAF domain-containing protein [Anaerolineales bacterium]MCX7755548.1 GAF domain-containing protein [Anaerolineales bacterium]MDW8278413.1 GAF domain-containing protein [Anaerolineales bacterium]